MEPEEYAAFRRTRLVEHAVGLGVEAASAEDLVDRVLAEQRRRIERAEDPDPLVRAALEAAVHGPAPARGPRLLGTAGVVVALVALLALGLLGWGLLRPTPRPPQVAVPVLYALDVNEAVQALQGAGLAVGVTTSPACEPRGLVIGSDTAVGTRVDPGRTVSLTVAAAPSGACRARADRRAAWEFLRFTRGGPAPSFAPTVYVVVDGRAPAVLPRAAVLDPRRWAGVQDVADAISVARPEPGEAALRVTSLVPPRRRCGVERPSGGGTRRVLRLDLPISPGLPTCPFTVDLYRSGEDRSIDAIAIYTPR